MIDLSEDYLAIIKIIKGQFASLCWDENSTPDISGFTAPFLDNAQLCSSKRPVAFQTPDAFAKRMDTLRSTGTIQTFHEESVGLNLFVAGNVAVAAAGCKMLENESDITQDISVFLLLKSEGEWRILSQAWDIVEDINEWFTANSTSGIQ